MTPEEDKIALVVESAHLTTFKLWHLRKQGSKHSPGCVPKSRIKIVEDQLWMMAGDTAVILSSGSVNSQHAVLDDGAIYHK